MYKFRFFALLLTVLLGACNASVQSDDKPNRQKAADEDEVIGRYSAQLITNPRTQDEIDQNIILKFLIDSLWDFQKTSSGIYYQIEKEGEGGNPTLQSKVTTHYRGMLLDGTVFDSSYKKGTPLMIPLNRVIPGWQEALQMLKPGGKGTFIIPSSLAYGKRGFSNLIGPDAVLIFEVELIKFR